MRRLNWLWAAFLIVAASCGDSDEPQQKIEAAQPQQETRGRLERIDGYLVLHVEGTPEEMGEQHGRLLKSEIQRACKALIKDAYPGETYKQLINDVKAMEKYQPEEFRRELEALAKAAGIDYWDCVAMQVHGDVDRAQQEQPEDEAGMQCTAYAAFGEATRTGELIVGRNLDYWDAGVGEYGAVLMHARPDKGHAFVTVTWAGVINGWTLMNEKGLVTANNTSISKSNVNSLEGISTCFLLRKVAQHASTVDEGIEIVKTGPRACGTNMLIAGGDPPDAAIVEYDHTAVAVRRAEKGYVLASNHFRKLHRTRPPESYVRFYSRYGALHTLIQKHLGRIDRSMNFAAAEGVPMTQNLHSALLFPKNLILRVSMGETPAYKYRYRGFQMTQDGIVAEKD